MIDDTEPKDKPSPSGTDNPYFDMLFDAISTPAAIVSDNLFKPAKERKNEHGR